MATKPHHFELAVSTAILSAGLFLGQQGLANWGLALVGLLLLNISVMGQLARRGSGKSESGSIRPSAAALHAERAHAN